MRTLPGLLRGRLGCGTWQAAGPGCDQPDHPARDPAGPKPAVGREVEVRIGAAAREVELGGSRRRLPSLRAGRLLLHLVLLWLGTGRLYPAAVRHFQYAELSYCYMETLGAAQGAVKGPGPPLRSAAGHNRKFQIVMYSTAGLG